MRELFLNNEPETQDANFPPGESEWHECAMRVSVLNCLFLNV